MNKTVLVPIASGIEELEAVTIIDVLRRAQISVRVCSVEEREIVAANKTKIVADSEFMDEVIDDYDAIILPGGTRGAEFFCEYTPLTDALKEFANNNNKYVAAICASPALVLARHKILDNKKATCYPSLKDHLKNYVNEKVVIDGNIITSQGPGTAFLFSIKLAEILAKKNIADNVASSMLFK